MQGAVENKLQEVTQKNPPTLGIVQRSSYGFVLDEEYDPARHRSTDQTYQDEYTGKTMVRGRIKWMVRKVWRPCFCRLFHWLSERIIIKIC